MDFQPLATGTLCSLLLLAIEHFALWEMKLPLVARYALGVGSIGVGFTLTGVLRGLQMGILDFWVNVIASGILIAALHYWRWKRGERPADIDDAFHAGELAQRALGDKRNGVPREPVHRDN